MLRNFHCVYFVDVILLQSDWPKNYEVADHCKGQQAWTEFSKEIGGKIFILIDYPMKRGFFRNSPAEHMEILTGSS